MDINDKINEDKIKAKKLEDQYLKIKTKKIAQSDIMENLNQEVKILKEKLILINNGINPYQQQMDAQVKEVEIEVSISSLIYN